MLSAEENKFFDTLSELNRAAFALQVRNIKLQQEAEQETGFKKGHPPFYFEAEEVDKMLFEVAHRVFRMSSKQDFSGFSKAIREIIQNVKAGK